MYYATYSTLDNSDDSTTTELSSPIPSLYMVEKSVSTKRGGIS